MQIHFISQSTTNDSRNTYLYRSIPRLPDRVTAEQGAASAAAAGQAAIQSNVQDDSHDGITVKQSNGGFSGLQNQIVVEIQQSDDVGGGSGVEGDMGEDQDVREYYESLKQKKNQSDTNTNEDAVVVLGDGYVLLTLSFLYSRTNIVMLWMKRVMKRKNLKKSSNYSSLIFE